MLEEKGPLSSPQCGCSEARGPRGEWPKLRFITKIPVYVFQRHFCLSASVCAPSVTQLANGFFRPIIRCKAPVAQFFFFLNRIIGVLFSVF